MHSKKYLAGFGAVLIYLSKPQKNGSAVTAPCVTSETPHADKTKLPQGKK